MRRKRRGKKSELWGPTEGVAPRRSLGVLLPGLLDVLLELGRVDQLGEIGGGVGGKSAHGEDAKSGSVHRERVRNHRITRRVTRDEGELKR